MNIVDFKEWLEQFPDDTEIWIARDYGGCAVSEIFDENDIFSWYFDAVEKDLCIGFH